MREHKQPTRFSGWKEVLNETLQSEISDCALIEYVTALELAMLLDAIKSCRVIMKSTNQGYHNRCLRQL
jgi:hypothetical protein